MTNAVWPATSKISPGNGNYFCGLAGSALQTVFSSHTTDNVSSAVRDTPIQTLRVCVV